jgi:hypothetical protein
MTATTKEKGRSFRELKAHLPLFDESLHRHERGWPHRRKESSAEGAPKRRWKTIGIVHFPHDDEDDGG